MKKKFLAISTSALLLLGAAAGGVLANLKNGVFKAALAENEPPEVDGVVQISTAAQFARVFNGTDGYCGKNIALLADIDLGSAFVSGMAGTYTGTFNGQGHTISNAVPAANQSLFNFMAGTVTNFVLEASFSGAVIRPICYQNNGTLSNITVRYTITANNTNNVGAFAYLAGSGNYNSLRTEWNVGSYSTEWLCCLYRDQSSDKVNNCTYYVTGSGTRTNFQTNGAVESENPPSSDTISLQSTATVKVGRDLAITATTEAAEVTWSSSDNLVATVTGTTKNATITGVAIGEAVITAELENGQKATCTVSVIANESEKLSVPVGLVLNNIGDGGYLCAFADVAHASGYRFEYYDVADSTDSSHLVGSHTGGNGAALNPSAAGLTAGENYYIRVVTLGDGVDYENSDPSGVVGVNNGNRKGLNYYTYHTGESYADYLLGLNMCSTNGESMEFGSTEWNAAKAEYDNVFVGERNNLKGKTTTSATNAISQYNYILGKYSETEYSWLKDFIGTGATRPSSSRAITYFGTDTNANTSVFAIIVVTSMIAAASLGFVLYSKKRKEQ